VSAAASKERKRAVLEILEGNRPERRSENADRPDNRIP
jgi:hypothetical protein